MFYCGPCATEREWPMYEFLPQSFGPCEVCNYPARCFDVPSSQLDAFRLTPGQEAQNEEIKAIDSIKQTIERRSSAQS